MQTLQFMWKLFFSQGGINQAAAAGLPPRAVYYIHASSSRVRPVSFLACDVHARASKANPTTAECRGTEAMNRYSRFKVKGGNSGPAVSSVSPGKGTECWRACTNTHTNTPRCYNVYSTRLPLASVYCTHPFHHRSSQIASVLLRAMEEDYRACVDSEVR